MRYLKITIVLLLLSTSGLTVASTSTTTSTATTSIDWQTWSAAPFQDAADNNRFVLLNLEAVWCHWCHVMDQRTYADSKVIDYLQRHFVAVKVDHDARPDLAERYRRWGWPATIIFAADGTEIAKRRGFMSPDDFLALLQAVVADPSPQAVAQAVPVASAGRASQLDDELRDKLVQRNQRVYDSERGGLPFGNKFLPGDTIEWALYQSESDPQQAQRARQTLDAAVQLIDPVWGGAYQYSTHRDWQHAHYEKINRTQARYLRIYALAYAQFQRAEDLQAARQIASYLREFWQAENGVFYTSQDADLVQGEKAHAYFALDDRQRRSKGIPRIDKHQYARENGKLIEGLAMLYEYAGDQQALDDALQAAEWVMQHRRLPGGGFAHGDNSALGPYLGDTLAMGRATLQLYRATGNVKWLKRSASAADFIGANFKLETGGLSTAVDSDTPIKPLPDTEENISAARYLNLLAHYTGKTGHRELADFVLAWLATPVVALEAATESGILLADAEFRQDPQHLTVVGSHADKHWPGLRQVALRQHGWYKRLDTWNPADGPAYNDDITYPELDQVAGFYCADQRCSLPAKRPAAFQQLIDRWLDEAED